MADQNSTTNSSGSTPSDGGARRPPCQLSLEIEESLCHARTLNDLAMWIVEARGFIDALQSAVSRDAELAGRIASLSLGLYSAEWNDAETEGLQHLHMVIGENLHDIASMSGLLAHAS